MIKIRCETPFSDEEFVRLYGGAWIDVMGVRYRRAAAGEFLKGAWSAIQRTKPYGLRARPEPDNKWDANAIAIDGYFSTSLGFRTIHVGYLPSEVAEDLQGREYKVAMASGYLSDSGFADIELIVFARREVEDVLAKIDKAAERVWVREFAMPGLKILAHIAAADGGSDDDERRVMNEYAERVRLYSGGVIDDFTIARAISDALEMAPSLESLRANYRRLAKHAEAAGDLLECALKLAKLGGIEPAEAVALRELLAIEQKVSQSGP
ncbi:HIRAN domain-containing protein [Kaistia sp. MMO-174]|uniref:HIRAN domain-containing protein n=1 Tax=Kaistia sp. MMO-174 TaxID=3081256 RepID=UPI003018E62F